MVQAGAWRLVNTNIRVNCINPVSIFYRFNLFYIKKYITFILLFL